MGYLGSQATFTGTQNNKRISIVATQGQVDFLPQGGYSVSAIDVYRNGVKLVGQRDFTALDGVTVTLVTAANADDILEFVIFENFAVDAVVSTDGDSVINGNVTVNEDFTVGGTLNASVSNTLVSGIATEAIRAGMSTNSTRAGIATQVDGFLGVGVTGYNLNVTGVITANSFSGDGSSLTGVAATDDVSTNGLVVLGISTLAGATFSGVSTFSNNVTFEGNLDLQDNDKILLGTGDDLEIYHDGTNSYVKENGTGNLKLLGNNLVLKDSADGDIYVECVNNGAVSLYHDNTKKLETDPGGVKITGIATADGFRAGDSEKVELGAGQDLQIYHNGTHSYIDNQTGALILENNVNDNDIILQTDDGSGGLTDYIQCDGSTGEVKLFHYGSEKLETASGGINVGVGITMDGNGIAVSGILTSNGITVGQNAIGARTVQSGGSPSGGSNGDIYYIY
jgi:hypothetical protein